MQLFFIFFVALATSMDSFAVSITNGMSISDMNAKKALHLASLFAFVQSVMPIIGYVLGSVFYETINKYSRFVEFSMLTFLGVKMILSGIEGLDCERENSMFKVFTFGIFILQAFATSLDAMALGITFIAKSSNVFYLSCMIFCVTFIMCFVGMLMGKRLTCKFGPKFEIFGGLTLCAIGIFTFL